MTRKANTAHDAKIAEISVLVMATGLPVEALAARLASEWTARTEENKLKRPAWRVCVKCDKRFRSAYTKLASDVFCSQRCRAAFFKREGDLYRQSVQRAERRLLRAIFGLDPDKDDLRKPPLWDLDAAS